MLSLSVEHQPANANATNNELSLANLPDDIILRIIPFITPVSSIISLRLVCHRFYDLTHQHAPWSTLYNTYQFYLPPIPPSAYTSAKEIERTILRAHKFDRWWDQPQLHPEALDLDHVSDTLNEYLTPTPTGRVLTLSHTPTHTQGADRSQRLRIAGSRPFSSLKSCTLHFFSARYLAVVHSPYIRVYDVDALASEDIHVPIVTMEMDGSQHKVVEYSSRANSFWKPYIAVEGERKGVGWVIQLLEFTPPPPPHAHSSSPAPASLSLTAEFNSPGRNALFRVDVDTGYAIVAPSMYRSDPAGGGGGAGGIYHSGNRNTDRGRGELRLYHIHSGESYVVHIPPERAAPQGQGQSTGRRETTASAGMNFVFAGGTLLVMLLTAMRVRMVGYELPIPSSNPNASSDVSGSGSERFGNRVGDEDEDDFGRNVLRPTYEGEYPGYIQSPVYFYSTPPSLTPTPTSTARVKRRIYVAATLPSHTPTSNTPNPLRACGSSTRVGGGAAHLSVPWVILQLTLDPTVGVIEFSERLTGLTGIYSFTGTSTAGGGGGDGPEGVVRFVCQPLEDVQEVWLVEFGIGGGSGSESGERGESGGGDGHEGNQNWDGGEMDGDGNGGEAEWNLKGLKLRTMRLDDILLWTSVVFDGFRGRLCYAVEGGVKVVDLV